MSHAAPPHPITSYPIYLGIDSASPYLTLALWSPEGVLGRFCEEVGRDHAVRIGAELEALLKRAGVDRRDLAGVGVGTGPGSYTGLRVGVATAKGIAQGLGVPLRGERTLAAMAASQLSAATPRGIVALDARRGNVYASVFERVGGELRCGDVEKVARADLSARYPDLPLFEKVAPDAAYLARRAAEGANSALPLYL